MLRYALVEESYKSRYGIAETRGNSKLFEKRNISLVAARNDWAAFQVLLCGDEEYTLSVGSSPCFSPKGPLTNVRVDVEVEGLPANAVNVNLVGFVEDDDRVFKADILLHDEAVHVKPYICQPVWVEIEVPADTETGRYYGQVSIYSHVMFDDEERIDTLDFELEVKDVVMPSPCQQKFHLDLWQHLSNIARKHEVPLWSEEHFRVVENYVKSLAELGQRAVTAVVSEIPWSGQSCFHVSNYPSDLFEYNMVRVIKNEKGCYIYDYTALERYVELCFKHGIDKEIEVFGLINIWVQPDDGYGSLTDEFPDAIRIRYYDEAGKCFRYMRAAADIEEYIKSLERFFTEKGWIDKVRVVADEPGDVELYSTRLDNIKRIAPSFQYKTAINHAEFVREFRNAIQDFVPDLNCISKEWDLLKEMRQDIKGRLMWYVCCWPPFPNTFICSHLLESRFIGLFTAYMNFDGFLRWNYTVWPEKPRERISYRAPNWVAGDTNFVYPANDGRPLLTLRYKNLKRGIGDFELVRMLKDKLPGSIEDVLEAIRKRIIKVTDIRQFNPLYWKGVEEIISLDAEDYTYIKKLLLDRLAQNSA